MENPLAGKSALLPDDNAPEADKIRRLQRIDNSAFQFSRWHGQDWRNQYVISKIHSREQRFEKITPDKFGLCGFKSA